MMQVLNNVMEFSEVFQDSGSESVGSFYDKAIKQIAATEEEKDSKMVVMIEDYMNRFSMVSSIVVHFDISHDFFFQQIDDSSDNWYDLSFYGWSEMFEDDPEDVYYLFKADTKYTDLLNHFTSQIPPAAIRLGKQVVRLENLADKIRIHIKGDPAMEADYVIFTPSVGVLKWAVSNDDFFEPRLPSDKVKAIESLGFGSVAKIIMRYRR